MELDTRAQTAVTYLFWGDGSNQLKKLNNSLNLDLIPDWSFYVRGCHAHVRYDGGRHIAIRTHADVVDIAAQLQSGLTRAVIKDNIRTKLTSPHRNEEEILENSINLVSSLLLMIHCGTFSYGFSGQTELQWAQGSLRQRVADYFAQPPKHSYEGVKLEKNFTGPNLSWIAGLEMSGRTT